MLSKLVKNLAPDLSGGARAVDGDDSLGEGCGELLVGLSHALAETVVLALDPVAWVTAPPGRLFRVDDEQVRAVGEDPADRMEIELEHAVEPEPTRDSLIGERRVDVAVAHDVRATGKGRRDHLVDELGARGGEQRGLRPRRNLARAENQLADQLADLGSARLAGGDHVAIRRERFGEQLRLRGLAGPVEAFERHEHAALGYEPLRAIVTGGAGFIGSHVVDALVARGDDVLVLDDLSNGKRENVPDGARLEVVDIREPLDFAGAEVCFHLGAQADVRVAVERPEHDAQVNVLGTVNVLEAARPHGTQVVFASTGGAIYGECEGPVTENATRQPLSPYGVSKLAGEEYLAAYNRLYGTSHVSLRFANVYGPRQDPHGEAGVVAIFLGRLAAEEPPRIFGDGSQTRDYVYAGDVARSMLAAIGKAGVFNVGTGIETSVLELYELCRRVAGSELEAEHAAARLGELQRSVLDVTRADRELGWRPEVELEEGLRRTWGSIAGSDP